MARGSQHGIWVSAQAWVFWGVDLFAEKTDLHAEILAGDFLHTGSSTISDFDFTLHFSDSKLTSHALGSRPHEFPGIDLPA